MYICDLPYMITQVTLDCRATVSDRRALLQEFKASYFFELFTRECEGGGKKGQAPASMRCGAGQNRTRHPMTLFPPDALARPPELNIAFNLINAPVNPSVQN
jgi:hypothetical protein